MNSFKYKILLPIFFLLCVFSCKDDYLHPVPDVHVDFYVNINTHFELQNINGFVYRDDYGYNGIVIFRYSQDEFRAFDRACPHDVHDPTCQVEVFDVPLAEDLCCNSQFLLLDGSVVEGPSKHPLKEYRIFYDAETNYLHITN